MVSEIPTYIPDARYFTDIKHFWHYRLWLLAGIVDTNKRIKTIHVICYLPDWINNNEPMHKSDYFNELT